MVPPRTQAFRGRHTTLAFDRQAALAKLCRITQSDANFGFGRCGGMALLLIRARARLCLSAAC